MAEPACFLMKFIQFFSKLSEIFHFFRHFPLDKFVPISILSL
jgi:hypothetical protein